MAVKINARALSNRVDQGYGMHLGCGYFKAWDQQWGDERQSSSQNYG